MIQRTDFALKQRQKWYNARAYSKRKAKLKAAAIVQRKPVFGLEKWNPDTPKVLELLRE